MTFPSNESLTKIYSSILSGHLQPFSKNIQELTSSITSATLELYKQIVQNHPPTPSKFHYIFNLRDLSRVYQGLCLTVPDRFENANQFVRVWRNECLRVFHDRLINAADKTAVQVRKFFLEVRFTRLAHITVNRRMWSGHFVPCFCSLSCRITLENIVDTWAVYS